VRQYTWDEYYEKFYDWAESTQVRNLSALTSLGTADEVGEIIIELQVNVPAANRLLRKAVEAKLAFSGSDLVEFACINDKALAIAAVRNSAERLTAEEEYEDEEPEEIEEDEPLEEVDIYVDDYCPPPKRPGFFATLFGVIAGIDMASGPNQHRHNGRCNGDCAHCPPHYGYRYGRWYYGHDHVHGCEFGGNRGSGSMD
jgi:hypothetical protein